MRNLIFIIILGEGIELKSIKPGRGPSAMDTIGSIGAAIFGVFWTLGAFQAGAPMPFPLFGVIFIVIAIIQAIYNYKNATRKDRMSLYDITDPKEESDPLDKYLKNNSTGSNNYEDIGIKSDIDVIYCPYCGSKTKDEFAYCPRCGKKINDI